MRSGRSFRNCWIASPQFKACPTTRERPEGRPTFYSSRGTRLKNYGYHKRGISCPTFSGSKKTLYLVMCSFLPCRNIID